MEQFPVEYSSLSVKALLQLVVDVYSIHPASTITFLKRGFNDTYLIATDKNKFILRVYKNNWRSSKSIKNEIELLNYLHKNDVSVSSAVIDRSGNYIQTLHAPEGLRYAVLFTYAKGERVRKLSPEQAFSLGIETGRIHSLTENKMYDGVAFSYGITEQFNTTINTVKPLLVNYPEQLAYLVKLKEEFENTFLTIDTSELATGICHGDLQAENFHISSNNTITFFDFDFFGSGYLVYDIGVFIWYDHKNKPKEIIHQFLKGYQTERKLTTTELQLLHWFSTLRALFQMTLYCKISDGKQLPLWPAEEVAAFIGKVEKWFRKKEFYY
jgi:Ser/Thr protein kinase RdoA (MazF antagonist)